MAGFFIDAMKLNIKPNSAEKHEIVNQIRNKSTDTIAALATPKGRGAIAIVRISGENAINVAAGLVKYPKKFRSRESHRLHLVDVLQEDGHLLDRALCAIFRNPNSYTGEDLVEFFLHGGIYIAAQTMERLCKSGARVAEPGEFTLRAFLNGRMDLAQAEAVADLVAAESAAAHRVAVLQREGALSQRISKIRERLIQICSMVELEIDFSEQDLPVVDRGEVLASLAEITSELLSLEESFKRGRLAREGATVVIAGAPNVGKSTLFNALLDEDRAIVDETPGTTRDAVEALVQWGGWSIRLIDTAGQAERFTGPDEKAVARSRQITKEADVVIWVMDLSETRPEYPPTEFSGRMITVGNKADLIADGNAEVNNCYLKISAKHGVGVDEVREAVLGALTPSDETKLEEGVLTRERHLEAVRGGLKSLGNAKRILKEGAGDELLAIDLSEAAAHLGEIIGEITPDDVLNRVFSDFCIGK